MHALADSNWICWTWLAHRFDVNNDGVLDEEEQKALVDTFGGQYKESIAAALEKADENHDGKVDAREVAKLFAEDTESESDAELTEDEETDDDDAELRDWEEQHAIMRVDVNEEEEEEEEEEGERLVTSSLVALHVTLPARHPLPEMDSPDDRRSELTCAAMNASWSRPEDVVAWHCDVIACDPPMADAPLRNGEALRGCERAHCCCRPPAPRLDHPRSLLSCAHHPQPPFVLRN
jgi:hypothetical protein